jgi:hypothetical protein
MFLSTSATTSSLENELVAAPIGARSDRPLEHLTSARTIVIVIVIRLLVHFLICLVYFICLYFSFLNFLCPVYLFDVSALRGVLPHFNAHLRLTRVLKLLPLGPFYLLF